MSYVTLFPKTCCLFCSLDPSIFTGLQTFIDKSSFRQLLGMDESRPVTSESNNEPSTALTLSPEHLYNTFSCISCSRALIYILVNYLYHYSYLCCIIVEEVPCIGYNVQWGSNSDNFTSPNCYCPLQFTQPTLPSSELHCLTCPIYVLNNCLANSPLFNQHSLVSHAKHTISAYFLIVDSSYLLC